MTPGLDQQSLAELLVAARIAGNVGTSRQDNLRNYARMAAGWPDYDFGLALRRPWTAEQVLAVMARRVGVDPDPTYLEGPDRIDPRLTVAALQVWRDRLAKAAAGHERVLLATGHPTGVLAVHLPIAAALRAAGCEVLVPDPIDLSWPWESNRDRARDRPRHVRCVAGVHLLAAGGELLHTHRPEPMRAVLTALAYPPDLVVADHGWAGAAAQAGIETLALADSNDPALFVAQPEGHPLVTVPLDDNVLPHRYDPIVRSLLEGWG